MTREGAVLFACIACYGAHYVHMCRLIDDTVMCLPLINSFKLADTQEAHVSRVSSKGHYQTNVITKATATATTHTQRHTDLCCPPQIEEGLDSLGALDVVHGTCPQIPRPKLGVLRRKSRSHLFVHLEASLSYTLSFRNED
jgi:hypothetical protein